MKNDTTTQPAYENQTASLASPSTACSAILDRIRVNDQFLDIVNDLYCDAPNLFEGLRHKALALHADVNRILREILRDSQQNDQVEARRK
jgi:hypothetical protein